MPRTYEKTEYGITYKYQIVRPRNGTGEETHPVFKDKRDFELFFHQKDGFIPPFCDNWRIAREGDWTQGDGKEKIDRGVVQILRKVDHISHPDDSPTRKYAERGYCRTIVGTFICNDNRTMTTDFDKITNRYRFDKKSHSITMKNRQNQEELTMIDRQWILSVSNSNFEFETMVGIWLLLRQMDKTPKNIDKAKKGVDKLLQREFVMNTLIKNIKQSAEDHGIDLEFVLNNYFDLAANSNRDDVRLNATDRCSQLIGLTDAIEKRKQKLLEQDDNDLPKSFDEYDDVGNASDIKGLVGNKQIEDAQTYEDAIEEQEKEEKKEQKKYEEKNIEKAEKKTNVKIKKDKKELEPAISESEENLDLSNYAV